MPTTTITDTQRHELYGALNAYVAHMADEPRIPRTRHYRKPKVQEMLQRMVAAGLIDEQGVLTPEGREAGMVLWRKYRADGGAATPEEERAEYQRRTAEHAARRESERQRRVAVWARFTEATGVEVPTADGEKTWLTVEDAQKIIDRINDQAATA